MNKLFKIAGIFLLFMTITGTIFAYNKTANKSKAEPNLNSTNNIECLYYNPRDFINIPSYDIRQNEGTIQGCIVPHHLLARDLIHEVFQHLAENQYQTVVLIGPDHESMDRGKIFTSLSNWQTPTGILETDRDLVNSLLKSNLVEINDHKVTMEHSVSSLIPFVNYYLKEVRVVSLVFTKQVKLADVESLLDTLYENINMDETLFIGSIDFSHYLSLEDAGKMDLLTLAAIENEDIRAIMSFGNDNLDSPITLVTMLKIMKKLEAEKSLLNRSNSELILQKRLEETTSYITYLFYKKQ